VEPKVIAIRSMSLDGFVADPTVIQGVGVTHLRYPVRKA
jgi:hypothetical protein